MFYDDPWLRASELEDVFDCLKRAAMTAKSAGEYGLGLGITENMEAASEAYRAAYDAALEWERKEERELERQYERAAM